MNTPSPMIHALSDQQRIELELLKELSTIALEQAKRPMSHLAGNDRVEVVSMVQFEQVVATVLKWADPTLAKATSDLIGRCRGANSTWDIAYSERRARGENAVLDRYRELNGDAFTALIQQCHEELVREIERRRRRTDFAKE